MPNTTKRRSPKETRSTLESEFHIVVDVTAGSQKPDRAVAVFLPDLEVALEAEEDGIFSAILRLSVGSLYSYRYVVWCGDKFARESGTREVIPSKKREIVLDKFNDPGKQPF